MDGRRGPDSLWRAVAAAVLVVSLVGGVVAPAAAGSARPASVEPTATGAGGQGSPGSATGGAAPTIVADYTFHLTPDEAGTVVVELEWRLPETVTAFRADLPVGTNVTDSSGFERDGVQRYRWTEESRTPSLRFEWTVGNDTVDSRSAESVDAGGWALLTRPDVDTRWKYTGERPAYEVSMSVDGDGIADGKIAYLGPYDTRTLERDGRRIRIVVPEPASEPAPEVITSLRGALDQLDVGDPSPLVTAFLLPATVRTPGFGGVEYDDAFWIRADTPARTPDNLWVHEYVHARQGYEPNSSMRWLDEGAADYLSGLVAYRTGLVSYDRFHRFVATDRYADETLSEPSTWPSGAVEYTKGRRVVAALDAELRARTDDRTFADVYRRVNAHEGELTYEDFRAIVVEVGGPALGDWLDEYVTTAAAPAVSDDPDRFDVGGTATPTATPTPTATATATPTTTQTKTSASGSTETATGRTVETAGTAGTDANGGDGGGDGSNGATDTGVPGLGIAAAVVALLLAALGRRRR